MISQAIPINDLATGKYGSVEAQARCKLAAVYRLVDLNGWSQVIYSHITLVVGQSDRFLINAFGQMYDEVTAGSLLAVDLNGNVLDSGNTRFQLNRPAFYLYSAIHKARSEIRCVLHIHTPACVAVGATKRGLQLVSQEAAILGGISYHDYMGLNTDDVEQAKIVEDLGRENKVMFLRNHGIVVCGESLEEALHLTHQLTIACKTQVLLSGHESSDLIVIPEHYRQQVLAIVRQSSDTQGMAGTGGQKPKLWDLEFEAQMRSLDNKGYKTGYTYRFN